MYAQHAVAVVAKQCCAFAAMDACRIARAMTTKNQLTTTNRVKTMKVIDEANKS